MLLEMQSVVHRNKTSANGHVDMCFTIKLTIPEEVVEYRSLYIKFISALLQPVKFKYGFNDIVLNSFQDVICLDVRICRLCGDMPSMVEISRAREKILETMGYLYEFNKIKFSIDFFNEQSLQVDIFTFVTNKFRNTIYAYEIFHDKKIVMVMCMPN